MTKHWRRRLYPLLLLAGSVSAHAYVDPTCPPWLGVAAAPRVPAVEAIWTRGGQRLALVDGRLLRRGSAYARGVVIAVHRESVVLRFPWGVRVWPLMRMGGIRKTWVFNEGHR